MNYKLSMELRHMRYFVAIAEELHFGRAAERMHIVQPALSQQIGRLEEELGVQLLRRTKRKVELTEAGRAFLEGARDTLARADSAEKDAKRAAQGLTGKLVVAFIGLACYNVLPEILGAYRERYPDVELVLHELTSAEQGKRLREGTIQVGFVRPPVDDEALCTETVVREPVVAILPENHPLADREMVPLEALAREPFIMVPRGREPNLYDLYVSMCRRAGFSPHVVQETNRIHTLVALVATGMGVAFASAAVTKFSRPGAVYRKLEGTMAEAEIALAWRREDTSPMLGNFLALAREITSPKAS
jgi:DNA-binding transcriptional LysR family regulator